MTKPLKLEKVQKVLAANHGNISAAARPLGVSRRCLYDWESKHPELKAIRSEASDTLVDLAEEKIQQAVERGEPLAVKLVLTRQGRGRGWGLSLDVGLHGEPTGVVHILSIPDNGRN